MRRHRQQRPSYVLLIIDVHEPRHYRHHHHSRHYHRRFLLLKPNRVAKMSNVAVNVGHNVTMSLAFLDQNGNPMLVTPTPDAPPVWTDTTPATGTLTASASGLTAVELAVAPGTDEVDVALAVGGVAFKALIDLTVSAAPQVLTSVAITAVVS